jgi:hypothetical protein
LLPLRQIEADQMHPHNSSHEGTLNPNIYDTIEPINRDIAMTQQLLRSLHKSRTRVPFNFI